MQADGFHNPPFGKGGGGGGDSDSERSIKMNDRFSLYFYFFTFHDGWYFFLKPKMSYMFQITPSPPPLTSNGNMPNPQATGNTNKDIGQGKKGVGLEIAWKSIVGKGLNYSRVSQVARLNLHFPAESVAGGTTSNGWACWESRWSSKPRGEMQGSRSCKPSPTTFWRGRVAR